MSCDKCRFKNVGVLSWRGTLVEVQRCDNCSDYRAIEIDPDDIDLVQPEEINTSPTNSMAPNTSAITEDNSGGSTDDSDNKDDDWML